MSATVLAPTTLICISPETDCPKVQYFNLANARSIGGAIVAVGVTIARVWGYQVMEGVMRQDAASGWLAALVLASLTSVQRAWPASHRHAGLVRFDDHHRRQIPAEPDAAVPRRNRPQCHGVEAVLAGARYAAARARRTSCSS